MKSTLKKHQASQNPLEEYLTAIESRLKTGKATEHTYRPSLGTFLESFNDDISAINEPKRVSCGAPDFIVLNDQIPLGYVETKDLGEDLDEVEKSEQLMRYRSSLGNLILTNYLEFRWYVGGNLVRKASIGDVWAKKIKVADDSFSDLNQLLNAFFKIEIPTITAANELAHRLAASAQIIRKLILEAFKVEDEDGWLHGWRNAFSQVLIQNLKVEEFADMFAQTLAYGYFTARIHHTTETEFSRFAAAKILPKTNPFLRQLFAEFAGVNMPDEISWAVDELVELLKRTDIKSILVDFSERDGKEDPIVHFYETFLKEYNPALRERRGVYYTPSPIVDYIVSSVDSILKKQFSRKDGLADEKTLILDPAVGTGSFLQKVVEKIAEKFKKKEGEWDAYVGDSLLERVFGFEILMAPYAVSHLKLGLQLQETGYKFSKKQRLGVFLTDTLEAAAKKSQEMLFNWVSDEANAASSIKKDRPIMVVVGNPPYSGESQNDGEWITELMRGYDTITNKKTASYFECDGAKLDERNTKWINDDYVKFIRFAQWRIENTGYGILAFVTNNGFLDNPTFRGMRQSLLKDFDEIYILDLHGNSDKGEVAPDGSKDENVFDIKRGVSISLLVRKENSKRNGSLGKVFRHDIFGDREKKYAFLRDNTIDSTSWDEVEITGPNYLFIQQDNRLRSKFDKAWSLTDIFSHSNVGIVTARDGLCIHFDSDACYSTIRDFAKMDPEEARSKYNLGDDVRDWKVELAQKDVINNKLDKAKVVPILYRPFDIRYTYFTGNSKGIHCMPRGETMRHMTERDNLALIATKQTKDDWGIWASSSIIGHKCFAAYDINSIFPLYLTQGDQKDFEHKNVNLDDVFLSQITEKVGLTYSESQDWIDKKSFGPEISFFYIIGSLSVPEYKEQFGEFLKREFPKVFLPANKDVFVAFAKYGKAIFEVASLERLAEVDVRLAKKGDNKVEQVKYDEKTGRLYFNKDQYFEGISKEAFESIIGGYQPAERWLRDRKNTTLSHEDIKYFKKIIGALEEFKKTLSDISDQVRELGGFSEAFVGKPDVKVKSLKVEKALKKVKEEQNSRRKSELA